jgi:hypothetical protein
LLEAQLSRMHQQHQQGSSSFKARRRSSTNHPHRLVSLSLCISNLLIMVTMPHRRVRSRQRQPRPRWAFAAALRGAHQSTSGAAFSNHHFSLIVSVWIVGASDRWAHSRLRTMTLSAALRPNALRAGPEALQTTFPEGVAMSDAGISLWTHSMGYGVPGMDCMCMYERVSQQY